MLRYKLLTLPKDVIGIPVISVNPSSISITSLKQTVTISPSTLNLAGGNDGAGYTAILSDDTVATLEVAPDGAVNTAAKASQNVATAITSVADANLANTAANFVDDEVTGMTTAGKTITKVGSKFIIRAKPQAGTTIKRALLTIVGNETGGFKTVSITVDPSQFLTLDVQTSAPLNTL